jgi:hypothetical protein
MAANAEPDRRDGADQSHRSQDREQKEKSKKTSKALAETHEGPTHPSFYHARRDAGSTERA